MSVSSDRKVQRLSIEGLRSSDVATLSVLVAEAMRTHIDRVEPSCVADLFALTELGLAGSLGAELASWGKRATREIADLPDGNIRSLFVQELGELPPESVPRSLRDAVSALTAVSNSEVAAGVTAVLETWAQTEPAPVVLKATKAKAAPRTTAAAAAAAAPAAKTAATRAAPKARAARTPAAMVDPRRAEWIREDSVARLASREYQERGLKESIFLAGIKHRSPYKDMTDEEIKTELRKLERERKLKHTGERWLVR